MAQELSLSGEMLLRTSSGGQVRLRLDGPGGNIWAGGNGQDGDLVMFRSSGDNVTLAQATIHLDGNGGNIWAGGKGSDGDLVLFPATATNINDLGQASIHLDGNGGNVWAGGNGRDGDLVLFPATATNINDLSQASIHLDGNGGNIWAGGNGRDGDLVLFPSTATNINDLGQATIHLDGQAGDIQLLNADCAEDFDIADAAELEPGDVVVLNEDAKLEAAARPYDTSVAGIVAGAGGARPGIVLGRSRRAGARLPIALVGRVFCKVDAVAAGIRVGDLLTTSARRGHAMKAAEADRSFGAVIGKALKGLEGGTGLIPVLVALQ